MKAYYQAQAAKKKRRYEALPYTISRVKVNGCFEQTPTDRKATVAEAEARADQLAHLNPGSIYGVTTEGQAWAIAFRFVSDKPVARLFSQQLLPNGDRRYLFWHKLTKRQALEAADQCRADIELYHGCVGESTAQTRLDELKANYPEWVA